MQLDLSEIVSRPGMRSAVSLDESGVPDPDLVFLAPVKGHIEFQNGGDLLLIDGEVSTTLELACNRCLEPVRWPVTVRLEERFSLEEVLHPAEPPEEGSDWDTTVSSVIHLDAGKPILDLDELIRQQLITEIPLQTLCDEACRGLCPQCGANRNTGACSCPEETADSPFAVLAELIVKPNGDERS